MTSLADLVESRAAELAQRSIDTMYAEDPFWLGRFGERGRSYAREDAARHLQYLVVALRIGSAGPLVEYARWVQRVLTTRGMCTHHLAVNFERLASCLDESRLDDEGRARAFLADARAALAYPSDPGRTLGLLAEPVTGAVLARVVDPVPSEVVRALYSFLVDAVVLKSDTWLVKHLQWLTALASGQGWSASPTALLGELADRVGDLAPSLLPVVLPVSGEAQRQIERPTQAP